MNDLAVRGSVRQRGILSRLARGAAAGALATVAMDAAMLGAGVAGGEAFDAERLSPQIIGRWAAGLLHGRLRRDDISLDAPAPGELALGMAAHYATGIVLTETFLVVALRPRHRLRNAVAYGVATSVLPLFVMFPSMGYGACGRRSGEAAKLVRIMAVGHVAFGLGIGFWSDRFLGRGSDRRR